MNWIIFGIIVVIIIALILIFYYYGQGSVSLSPPTNIKLEDDTLTWQYVGVGDTPTFILKSYKTGKLTETINTQESSIKLTDNMIDADKITLSVKIGNNRSPEVIAKEKIGNFDKTTGCSPSNSTTKKIRLTSIKKPSPTPEDTVHQSLE
jgi:hypothetical protein